MMSNNRFIDIWEISSISEDIRNKQKIAIFFLLILKLTEK